MKLEYDQEANAIYVRFSDDRIVESEEVQEGVIFDFDEGGRIVGFELLDARRKLTPAALQSMTVAA
ncbi:MAG: DUF2283 domain-containing protein [Methylocystis sp.]|jgi:uncharacterized protein YuzE|nr:DUF2283 domain-containing protein [Methylocystis sp.]MCA3583627.1 DUF2283 domain-containing protein [Methylocystis sp.]MCA3586563.1 DUF2283 domain-containing protein [Methylocystis sp.]MCA3593286.1 DUF2283 domain-containing protein [Methylocystis sp.]